MSSAASAGSWDAQLEQGAGARSSGDIYQSVEILTQAVDSAPDQAARVRAMTQLGLSLQQSGRLADAEKTLQAAYDASTGAARISIALALGNVAAAEHDPQRASAFYRDVLAAPADSPGAQDAKIAAQLNLARFQPLRERFETLEQLYPRVEAIASVSHRARALFSLGQQANDAVESASITPAVPPAVAGGAGLAVVPFLRPARLEQMRRVSYESLSKAADLAQQSGDAVLRVEAFDALAQVYESHGRLTEALQINSDAAALAEHLKPGRAEALWVKLDWRAGRLNQRLGDDALALASYMHAARHLEAIRQDLPIEDAAGQSTYQSLLKPIYLNLLDLMLRNFDALPADQQPARLASVLDAIELTHQAEMQDYLGDRCSVDSIPGGAGAALQPGVAVIYTLVLNDRLEIIARTGDRLLHHAAPVSAATLSAEIATFRRQLLDAGSQAYLPTARRLYGWLIEPFESQLAKSGVRELVIVPDGYLRLIPFAALHDGREFIAQRYVISSVTGLTMTAASARSGAAPVTLLAGLSEPGPVVDKLLSMGFTGEPATDRGIRAAVIPAPDFGSMPSATLAADESALRSELVLPAVESEIRQLRPYGRSVALLNGEFTVARFQAEVRSGRYSVIHVATHGFFGDSARESFLLAFDNIIHMDDLQNLISDNGTQNGVIELLTLSACDTATGDERAPLGFAGAAIRARARSVVGTLWAVSDDAAEQFMTTFYAALARQGKADALVQAQRALIRSARFSHPYYWAPMLLIGDWT